MGNSIKFETHNVYGPKPYNRSNKRTLQSQTFSLLLIDPH